MHQLLPIVLQQQLLTIYLYILFISYKFIHRTSTFKYLMQCSFDKVNMAYSEKMINLRVCLMRVFRCSTSTVWQFIKQPLLMTLLCNARTRMQRVNLLDNLQCSYCVRSIRFQVAQRALVLLLGKIHILLLNRPLEYYIMLLISSL